MVVVVAVVHKLELKTRRLNTKRILVNRKANFVDC